MRNSLLEAALDYSTRLGWSIIPVCGKAAAGKWKKYQSRRPSDDELRKSFAKEGVTGMAVILGQVSGGLICRDFDDVASYETWRDKHPDLAARLPTVKTRRGYHVYFRYENVQNTVKFSDGELRGEASYVLVPPSKHPEGGTYQWVGEAGGDIPPIDDLSAFGLPTPADQPPAEPITMTYTSPFEIAPPRPLMQSTHDLCNIEEERITHAIETSLPSGPGLRNQKIFDYVRKLKRFVPNDTEDGVLRTVFGKWWVRARDSVGTKDFMESWIDFERAWKECGLPAGDLTFLIGDPSTLPVPREATQRTDRERIASAICRKLHEINGGGAFYLSCRDLGKLLGVSHEEGSRVLRRLMKADLIERAWKGNRYMAAEYRYLGERRDMASANLCRPSLRGYTEAPGGDLTHAEDGNGR